MKVIVALAFVLILGALAAAGVFMLRADRRAQGKEARMARALALRVGVSILLFVIILLSWAMGWIKPTGVPLAP